MVVSNRPSRLLACAALLVPIGWGAEAARAEASPSNTPLTDEQLDDRLDGLGDELEDDFAAWDPLDDEELELERDPDAEPREDPRVGMRPAYYDAATWPLAEIERPLALGPGMLELRTSLVADLSVGQVFDTVSLAPDVYYGITERLSIGLLHTRFATLGLPNGEDDDEVTATPLGVHGPTAPAMRPGDGLCVGEVCTRFYNNLGIDVRLALGAMRGPIQLRAHAGMEASSLGPLALGARAGVTGRLVVRQVALIVEPSARIGLLRRGAGNEDVLALPARAQLQVTPRVAFELASGVYGPLDDLRGGAQVPISAGMLAAASSRLDLGVSAGFPGAFGGGAPGLSTRVVSAAAAYRW